MTKAKKQNQLHKTLIKMKRNKFRVLLLFCFTCFSCNNSTECFFDVKSNTIILTNRQFVIEKISFDYNQIRQCEIYIKKKKLGLNSVNLDNVDTLVYSRNRAIEYFSKSSLSYIHVEAKSIKGSETFIFIIHPEEWSKKIIEGKRLRI